ncbi:phosphatase PAP2 family protein [Gemmatimonas sp.]|uniref:phosphatase PAP2 family protein n=1 Tax=Gemmatimonas sp. TaxID=1962908 RepID=UPI0033400B37
MLMQTHWFSRSFVGAASFRRARVALVAAVFVTQVSCDRTVQPTEALPLLSPASTDATAGAWRMLVLTSADQIAVPAPAAVTSDAYRAELTALKNAQGNMTNTQRSSTAYWSAGGVLRWNEVMRALVARFNLPPAPKADGTYPVPDPENPFADPAYPFANPPYAARSYAYVAVAQYEALKAAWFWKYRYNRPAPAITDGAVRTAVAPTELPSYPSEEAVLSGVTAEMLKNLFPGAVEEITRRAAEQREAAQLSGRATASDIAAGLALGKAVAAVVLARAANDGIRSAAGSAALWQGMANAVRAQGEIAWESQESPKRPPMLPNFGRVAAWTLTPAQQEALTPPPPPSTSSAQMQAELATVKRTVQNLTREQMAIAYKWNDGAGTYTPPGHWNDIAAEFIAEARQSEVRAARTLALLNMAMHDAGVACWDTKFRYYNPRPAQLDPSIKTVIGLPNFPAYPSGHSTFSAAAATVLSSIFPAHGAKFTQWADEAGISRLYGGIHFPSDISGGKAHGIAIGQRVVSVSQGDGAQR